MTRDYVVAVQAPAFGLGKDSFATESAFADHLKQLRRELGDRVDKLILIAPQMSKGEYEVRAMHLGLVNFPEDGIQYVPAHTQGASVPRFWFEEAAGMLSRMRNAMTNAVVVHSAMSNDLWRPFLVIVNCIAWRAKKPILFFVDIDYRKTSWRYYKLGSWSLRSYLLNRLIHDPFKWLQVWYAVRKFQLVMLKSASMVEYFGKGRSNVKDFFDTAHNLEQVLAIGDQAAHLQWIARESGPLRVVYFGRLVGYKGLDRAIEAIRIARSAGTDVVLTIIGDGEQAGALKAQVESNSLADVVKFIPQVRYGEPLFELLRGFHLSIATPLVEDTPRSAFDSMARGIPIVAFDIAYFRDLAGLSGAVALAEWPKAESLAAQFTKLHCDRKSLGAMAERALVFARENTQEIWLKRRVEWTLELVQLEGAAGAERNRRI